ncbi:MAG TPA: DUF4252 domain-containing protein [Bacteroidaceae bacterium]|nr:DUF4252 domain-containing protein [Bacteroidaceae bacterium]
MQRTLITLIALLFVAITGALHAQSLEKVFQTAQELPNHEIINLNGSMMKLSQLLGGNDEDVDKTGEIKSICILNLDDCSPENKAKIVDMIKKGGFKDYELTTDRRQGKEINQIWTLRAGDKIAKMIIITVDEEESEIGMVRLEGNFKYTQK